MWTHYLLTYLLIYLLYGAESFLRSYPVFSQSRNSLYFTEHEGSLLNPQVPATCPYPQPARPTSHFLKMHLIIILPDMLGSPKWSLFSRYPRQDPVYVSPLPHTPNMPRPSHSSRFDHSNDIW